MQWRGMRTTAACASTAAIAASGASPPTAVAAQRATIAAPRSTAIGTCMRRVQRNGRNGA